MLKVHNLDFQNTMPGGISQPHDRACVSDDSRKERHPLTGAEQNAVVFFGTLVEAHAFVAKQQLEAA